MKRILALWLAAMLVAVQPCYAVVMVGFGQSTSSFSGTFQWLATSATAANYPGSTSITANNGASVGVNQGEQSGNVDGYDKWFRVSYAAGLVNPLLGRASFRVYPTSAGKYMLRLTGTTNGALSVGMDGSNHFTFGYRYESLTTTATYSLNTWHTVTVWWDSANDDIGMIVDNDSEISNTAVGGVDLDSGWTYMYIGIYDSGSTGCGYITDVEVWDSKEGAL